MTQEKQPDVRRRPGHQIDHFGMMVRLALEGQVAVPEKLISTDGVTATPPQAPIDTRPAVERIDWRVWEAI